MVVDAGALAARVAKVDETHLILILEFRTPEDAGRIAREVGGPWMNAHIRPLLAGETERSVAEVIASAEARGRDAQDTTKPGRHVSTSPRPLHERAAEGISRNRYSL